MIDVMRWATGVDVWWVRRWWEAADSRGLAASELGAVTLLACGGDNGVWWVWTGAPQWGWWWWLGGGLMWTMRLQGVGGEGGVTTAGQA